MVAGFSGSLAGFSGSLAGFSGSLGTGADTSGDASDLAGTLALCASLDSACEELAADFGAGLLLIGLFLVVSFSGEAFLGVDSATGLISFLGVDLEGVPLLDDFSSPGFDAFFGSTLEVFCAVLFGDSRG